MTEPYWKRQNLPPHGTFNVDKCVHYLRHVGVDVSKEQAQQWDDAERVHRYLRSLGRKMLRKGVSMRCHNGHDWSGVKMGRGKGMMAHNAALLKCPECGKEPCVLSTEWIEALDGSVRDFRPKSERWRPRT